ncbi:hypothetical protein DMA11_10830 [Marinilabiliaceae bacterium JC017]|nr:hypothetical protein DMA11_10830 [Marinilabiliaceae bacterium JC017]
MKIKYSLFLNKLRNQKKKNTYIAKIKSTGNLDMAGLIAQMERHGGVGKGHTKMYVNLFFSEIIHALTEGYTVSTPLFTIKPVIKGVFDDFNDYFIKGKQELVFSISPGPVLKELPEDMRLQKQYPRNSKPRIYHVAEPGTKKIKTSLKPGELVVVCGERFYFPDELGDCGIYFMAGREKIKATQFMSLSKKEVLVMVPPNLQVEQTQLYMVVLLPKHTSTSHCLSATLPVALSLQEQTIR